ncbi:Hemolysin-type calcium-binding repeat-containing protein [Palleronia pelagia]|uniref:Hemolysin-type calcium-binding repeat-containing protein n=2 Tax=Palleronia pelagia TaxID=387096 RepID=A0A1H8LPF6_9RHOB|nr:Hemolysin-type calcium-binding repeat-containing protein [Palleronia pelagia]
MTAYTFSAIMVRFVPGSGPDILEAGPLEVTLDVGEGTTSFYYVVDFVTANSFAAITTDLLIEQVSFVSQTAGTETLGAPSLEAFGQIRHDNGDNADPSVSLVYGLQYDWGPASDAYTLLFFLIDGDPLPSIDLNSEMLPLIGEYGRPPEPYGQTGTIDLSTAAGLLGPTEPGGPLLHDDPTGTEGPDSLTGTDAADLIDGLGGNDTLDGGDGDDVIVGGAGDDNLRDGAGNDTVVGDDGEDTFYNFGGQDVFEGGAGRDRLVTDLTGLANDILAVDLEAGTHGRYQSDIGQDTLVGIEDFIAIGDWDVRAAGSSVANLLETDAGNDFLNGRGGDDSLRAGDGQDTLVGGAGNDTILGGATAADLRDVVYGGDGDDIIDGGYGNDELRGDAGNDDIAGGFGADTVIGGTGDDTLTGSAFGDEIFGGDGFDFINGGFGSDRVNGGAGGDRFFHLGIADHGNDWIQDYDAAEGDVLVYGGSATADQFQVNIATTPTAGDAGVDEAFVIYRPTGQILWALVDGDGQDAINLSLGGQVFDLTI